MIKLTNYLIESLRQTYTTSDMPSKKFFKGLRKNYKITAENLEYVFMLAHNTVNHGMDIDTAIDYINKDLKPESKEKIKQFYLCDSVKSVFDKTVITLHRNNRIGALKKCVEKTELDGAFFALGQYDYNSKNSSRKTAKTDCISDDGSIRISYKSAASSTVMSGAQCEARAILSSIIYKNTNKYKNKISNDTVNSINELLTYINSDAYHNEKAWNNIITQSKNILSQCIKNDKAFAKALLHEATTGVLKFGDEKLNAVPTHVLMIDIGKTTDIYFATIDEFINSHCMISNIKCEIGRKSSDNHRYLALRLNIKIN